MNTAELLHCLSEHKAEVWRDNTQVTARSKTPLKQELRFAIEADSALLCTLLPAASIPLSANALFEKYQEKFAVSWGNGTFVTRAGDYAILDVSKANSVWRMNELREALLRGFVVKNWSQRFQEPIYYVRAVEHLSLLRPLLPSETAIYSLDELRMIGKDLSSSKNFDIIHSTKKIFGAVIANIGDCVIEQGDKK